jgi:hypothetical protein
LGAQWRLSDIGIFHADVDGRASLALDAIEAIRPYVEYWLITCLQSTAFANRDFHELPDGEVRLSHPLTSHLAHAAALWRKASEPIAEWLARSFHRASRHAPMRAVLAPLLAAVSREKPVSQPLITEIVPTLAPPLPTFITAAGGRRISAPSVLKQRASVRDDPVPTTCWECARALSPEHRVFCSDDCADSYRQAMGKRRPVVERAHRPRKQHQEVTLGSGRAAPNVPASDRKALRLWYAENLQPRLSKMHPTEVAVGAAMGRSYAYYVVAGTRIPHPRHFPSLAALVGVELPKEFAAALSRREGLS